MTEEGQKICLFDWRMNGNILFFFCVTSLMNAPILLSICRYEDEQECEGAEACDKGKWFASLWGSCSKSCDGGTRKRKVKSKVWGPTKTWWLLRNRRWTWKLIAAHKEVMTNYYLKCRPAIMPGSKIIVFLFILFPRPARNPQRILWWKWNLI